MRTRTHLLLTVAAAAVLATSCSDGSSAPDADPEPRTVVADDGTTYTGTGEDVELIESMELNDFWPRRDAEDLISLSRAICAAYDRGGPRAAIQQVVAEYGLFTGEEAVYLDVIATGAYCPEYS